MFIWAGFWIGELSFINSKEFVGDAAIIAYFLENNHCHQRL
jgi:hypothetical protein